MTDRNESCPPEQTIRSYLGGSLIDDEATGIEEHLSACDDCSTVCEKLEKPTVADGGQ